MTKSLISLTVLALTVAANAQGATYALNSSLSGQAFLDAFEFQAIPDPTNGDVNYVNRSTAEKDGLYSIIDNSTVILRADNTTVLDGTIGRNSFNLKSLHNYTTHVAIFDIAHMPEGCGTWPAVFGFVWPDQGEIDIVEGVNNMSPNTVSLHTSPNCTMPATRNMTGQSLGLNCDVYETNNGGCGVNVTDLNSFGPGFNNIGGGWYAMERTPTYLSVWFWERNSSAVPSEVSSPGSTVNTSAWGVPAAYYPDTDCDFATHLGAQAMVIDLTFCGDWAGNAAVYSASGCPGTCTDYVNENPSAFTNAYFEFNSLNIYE